MILATMIAFLLSNEAFATTPAAELSLLTTCHEAIAERSDGTSQKMTADGRTPLALETPRKIYFVTESSMAVLPPPKPGTYVVTLQDQQKLSNYEIEVRGDGKLGSVCWGDGSGKKLPALTPHAQMDAESLGVFKQELVARLNTVKGSYQNKYEPKKTAEALKNCLNIDFGSKNKNLVEDLIAYYEKSSAKYPAKSNSSAPKKSLR